MFGGAEPYGGAPSYWNRPESIGFRAQTPRGHKLPLDLPSRLAPWLRHKQKTYCLLAKENKGENIVAKNSKPNLVSGPPPFPSPIGPHPALPPNQRGSQDTCFGTRGQGRYTSKRKLPNKCRPYIFCNIGTDHISQPPLQETHCLVS